MWKKLHPGDAKYKPSLPGDGPVVGVGFPTNFTDFLHFRKERARPCQYPEKVWIKNALENALFRGKNTHLRGRS